MELRIKQWGRTLADSVVDALVLRRIITRRAQRVRTSRTEWPLCSAFFQCVATLLETGDEAATFETNVCPAIFLWRGDASAEIYVRAFPLGASSWLRERASMPIRLAYEEEPVARPGRPAPAKKAVAFDAAARVADPRDNCAIATRDLAGGALLSRGAGRAPLRLSVSWLGLGSGSESGFGLGQR